MKKLFVLLLLVLTAGLDAVAQKISVSGRVLDGETQETVAAASVVLLKPDSTMAVGMSSDIEGKFSLPGVKAGKYILKVSYVGFRPVFKDMALTKGNRSVAVGDILLQPDAIVLKGADITARAAKVEMKADTFVYNSAAYRLPEGSALEELVKKLPGAEVEDDGTIKINGKEVKKIMVDGKEFFNNDTKMAMKNLPTDMVEKIKAYDRKSDYARMTGVDDGEEETVLDLSVKKGMKEGWLVNTDVGYGTEDRYTGKAMVNRFTDRLQLSVIGSANNVNDRGFPGGGPRGFGGGGGGLVASKMAGVNFAWENGKKEREAGALKLGGSVRYNHTGTDSENRTNSETFLTGGRSSSFSNSRGKSISGRTSADANFRFEWAIDSMTTLLFRPNFSYSENDSWSNNSSVTFNSDPYKWMTDPLKEYEQYTEEGVVVNSNRREAMSEGKSRSTDASLMLNRRLNKPGRNLTLRVSGGYSDSENTSFSKSNVTYYLETDADKRNSYTHQYNLSPTESYNYRAQASYNEPLFKGAVVQFSYAYQYRYSDSDRTMYSLDSLIAKDYISEDELPLVYIPTIEDWEEICKNRRNSQYATYKEHNQEASVMFRYTLGEMRLNAGVSLQPQKTYMDYEKGHIDTTVTRQVFNWAPRVDFRYKISQTSQVRLRYNGSASQPSMTNLLDVTDDSDPLNVSMGNPGLKPAWTNRFNLFYNNYITEKQMGWMVHANMDMTQNSISNAVTYDEETGKRISQPMNINGNWRANTWLMFNSALGPKKYFNIHTSTSVGYNNSVGYINSGREVLASAFAKSSTKSTNVGERLNLNFRNDFIDLGVNGNINYQHARNALQENANLDTYSFSYGGSAIFTMPWHMSLSTDIGQDSRRGYDDATMNTNELIWNAQLSQSFLKNNAATVSLQWYDILRNRSNISRSITASGRTDTWTNAINSYVMVHFIYRLNLMGNRETRGHMRGPGGPGGPVRMSGVPMMPAHGGRF